MNTAHDDLVAKIKVMGVNSWEEKGMAMTITVDFSSSSKTLNIDTNEEYGLVLKVKDGKMDVSVHCATPFGYRHALETLSQLVSYDPQRKRFQIVSSATIKDSPKFRYRGLLLDTGRNYFSVSSIERIIRGMSYDKLNVLHWHMNEQQSFPFVSNSVPELTRYGAYDERKVYTPGDVQHLTKYAYLRGVILLPEFDAPAHASFGWQWGQLKGMGNLVVCQQKEWADGNWSLAAEPPAGQLNPLNANVYDVSKMPPQHPFEKK